MSVVNIVLDGPPGGPEGGRFVEVERTDGKSVRVGTWSTRADGTWALTITAAQLAQLNSVDPPEVSSQYDEVARIVHAFDRARGRALIDESDIAELCEAADHMAEQCDDAYQFDRAKRYRDAADRASKIIQESY